MHEMHAIGNKRNASTLIRLHKIADRVEMREGPERLLASPAAGENDWTSDAAKIRIEPKAPGVESAVRREQPVQDGNAHGACGGRRGGRVHERREVSPHALRGDVPVHSGTQSAERRLEAHGVAHDCLVRLMMKTAATISAPLKSC